MDSASLTNTGVAADANMVNLVNALKEIAGIETFSAFEDQKHFKSGKPSAKTSTISMDIRQGQIGRLAIATIHPPIDVLDLNAD